MGAKVNAAGNTPQARDDAFTAGENSQVTLDVMSNDLGGAGKSLYSLNQASPTAVSMTGTTFLGAQVSIVNGQVVYSANSAAINALASGQTVVDTFTYTIQLGNNGALSVATVSVTLTGTNDAPVVSGVVSGSAVEDGAGVTLKALSNATDVDAGAVLDVVGLGSLPAGVSYSAATKSFTLNPSDAAYQSLGAGQATTVTVNYAVTDGSATTPASLSWTLTGTNDGPVANADVGAATEDGAAVTLNVLANDTDIDNGDNKFLVSLNTAGTVGSVTANPDGTLSYDPGAKFQSLGVGQTATDTFTYTMKDSAGAASTTTVTMTITGANDGPVAVADSATAGEDGAAVTINVLANDTDVDNGDSKVLVSLDTTGTVGSVSANADGTVTYDPAAKFQSLAAGQTATDTFTYSMRDAAGAISTATVTVTVTGENDAPRVSGVVTGAAAEDGSVVTLNALTNASDVDTGAVLQVTNLPSSLPAGVTYDAAAAAFSLDPSHTAYQALAQGQTLTVSVSYDVTDGSLTAGAQVTWTVTGQNDAPRVTGVQTASVVEGAGVSQINALANASDIDNGSVLHVSATSLAAGVTLVGDVFNFNPGNSAYDHLNVGQTETVTVHYTVGDGIAGVADEVSWVVTGVNDAAVITGAATGSVTEAGAAGPGTPTASGQLFAADVDNAANTFQTVTNAATSSQGFGSYTLTSTGTWTYALNNANTTVNALNNGQTLQDSFTVYSADGTAKVVNVTIAGANDAAVNSLVNPGFETGNFSGWTVTSNAPANGVAADHVLIPNTLGSFGATYVQVRSGDYAMWTDVRGDGVGTHLSQQVFLSAGTHTMGFYVTSDSGNSGYGDSTAMSLDGVALSYSRSGIDGHGVYRLETATFNVATAGVHTVDFFISGSGSGMAGFSGDDFFVN